MNQPSRPKLAGLPPPDCLRRTGRDAERVHRNVHALRLPCRCREEWTIGGAFRGRPRPRFAPGTKWPAKPGRSGATMPLPRAPLPPVGALAPVPTRPQPPAGTPAGALAPVPTRPQPPAGTPAGTPAGPYPPAPAGAAVEPAPLLRGPPGPTRLPGRPPDPRPSPVPPKDGPGPGRRPAQTPQPRRGSCDAGAR